jgi:signal transduction histidine kinase
MDTYRIVEQSISNTIKESSALIHTNFSAAPAVRFSSTYMESIFLNLITNAIKYARKDRKPILFIYSMETEDAIQLVFEDNGLGFNLNKVQHRLFGLYQKFHNHPDSKGIGLYLVHSQITALGGSIEVESEENEGTKFIISFPNHV